MRKLVCIIVGLCSLSFYSCHDDGILVVSESQECEDLVHARKLENLKFDVEDLSATDAQTVANLFGEQNTASRSGVQRNIKNVETIYGEDGTPAIYAVNYDDGYILVSATTKYFPILAEVEHGTFSIAKSEETGLSVILPEMVEAVELARSGEIDINCKSLWARYKEDEYDKLSVKSRAYDNINSALDELVANYDMQFKSRLYRLNSKECRDLLPEDVYAEFCSAAADEDAWAETMDCWENTAFVIATDHREDIIIGPLVTSHWHQGTPYKVSSEYEALGCVTIATGQLMRYYRKPSYMQWDLMPDRLYNSSQSPVLTSFLGQLREDLNCTGPNSGSNIDKAKSVFEKYGYNVRLVNHSIYDINTSVRAGKPVYARGVDPSSSKGHAWIIDGFRYIDQTTEYRLFRLANYAYPEYLYDVTEPDMQWYDTPIRYSLQWMNWGWGGSGDGWYTDDNIANNGVDFRNNRKELIFQN